MELQVLVIIVIQVQIQVQKKQGKNKGLSLKGICKTPMIPEWKLKMMAKGDLDNKSSLK